MREGQQKLLFSPHQIIRIKINFINKTKHNKTQKQAQKPQRRKSSNISNPNASDDLQLAIAKMLPAVNFGGGDVKPQVRIWRRDLRPPPPLTRHSHNRLLSQSTKFTHLPW